MTQTTAYRMRRLGAQLRRGQARIQGRACDGAYWPEGNHYWVVDDLQTQRTYHVLVAERPSWQRYAPASA